MTISSLPIAVLKELLRGFQATALRSSYCQLRQCEEITLDPRLTLNWFPLSSAVLLRLRIDNDSQSETLTDSSFMVFTLHSAAVPSSSLLLVSLFTPAGLVFLQFPHLFFYSFLSSRLFLSLCMNLCRHLDFQASRRRQKDKWKKKTSSFYLFINLFTRTFMFV